MNCLFYSRMNAKRYKDRRRLPSKNALEVFGITAEDQGFDGCIIFQGRVGFDQQNGFFAGGLKNIDLRHGIDHPQFIKPVLMTAKILPRAADLEVFLGNNKAIGGLKDRVETLMPLFRGRVA